MSHGLSGQPSENQIDKECDHLFFCFSRFARLKSFSERLDKRSGDVVGKRPNLYR